MTLRLLPGSFDNGVKCDPTKSYIITKTSEPPEEITFTDFLCVEKVYSQYWIWSPYVSPKLKYENLPKLLQLSIRHTLRYYDINPNGYMIFLRPDFILNDLSVSDILLVPSDYARNINMNIIIIY